ncbi:hypothetical protein PTKIN_Ptkin01aG0149400 [Pterospermum kingtungense]
MIASILGRWDMDANIIEGDVGFELIASTRFSLVAIAITRLRVNDISVFFLKVICSICDTEQPVFQTGHVMLNDNSDVAVISIGCEIFKDCVLELEPYSEWVQSDGISSWKYPANSKASSYGKRKTWMYLTVRVTLMLEKG